MPPYAILPIDGMIPGPGYSSVRMVKYCLSVRLLTPNLNSYFSSLYEVDKSMMPYDGMSPTNPSGENFVSAGSP